jgi:hypothetical protein
VDDRFIVEKVQNSIFEYNHLLTSQLEEQRTVYEKRMELASQETEKELLPLIFEADLSINGA